MHNWQEPEIEAIQKIISNTSKGIKKCAWAVKLCCTAMQYFIRHVNPQPVNAPSDRAGSTFIFFLKNFLRWNHVVQNIMWGPPWRLCTFCAPLSRRRPGGSAWRAASVKTTTRSGSCFISSMLWYSCCSSRKSSSKQHPRTILRLSQRRWISQLQFFNCKLVHGPFLYECFLYTSEITSWIKPDGWIHWSVWTYSCNSSCYSQSWPEGCFLPQLCH